MGKIDDMRRMREATFAADARPTAKRASTTSEPDAGGKAAAAEEQGRCSVCGKVRPLDRGTIGSHQKGLGKACPGSRKAPAA